MVEQREFLKAGLVNTDVLAPLLVAALPAIVTGMGTKPNPAAVMVYSTIPLTAPQIATLDAIIQAHDGSILSADQTAKSTGKAALITYLNNNSPDLKYGDYFFRLHKVLHDFWRPPRPILSDRVVATIAGLKGNKDTDQNHMDMWNTFLDIIQVEGGLTVTAGEIVITGTASQQAAIGRTIIQFARAYMNEGLDMIDMLLENQILN